MQPAPVQTSRFFTLLFLSLVVLLGSFKAASLEFTVSNSLCLERVLSRFSTRVPSLCFVFPIFSSFSLRILFASIVNKAVFLMSTMCRSCRVAQFSTTSPRFCPYIAPPLCCSRIASLLSLGPSPILFPFD